MLIVLGLRIPDPVKNGEWTGWRIMELQSDRHMELMIAAPPGVKQWTAGLAIHGGLNLGKDGSLIWGQR